MTSGAEDDADRADGVGEHLEVGALDVQRLLGALAQERERDEVGHEAGDGDDEHRAGEHVDRIAEAADRLDEDVDGDAEQQHRVGQGGEDLQAVQAERAVRALVAAAGEVDGGEGHADADDVGEHVAGVRQQGERAGDDARRRPRRP